VILSLASKVYGTAAVWRRRWYAGHPSRRRRLDRPVISVGNLSTGGSGKTPIVAHIAALLAAHGERPAILSRGYGRTVPTAGVTVVSDGAGVLAPLDRAGDEPLMLARALPNVPVLVCADRHQAGRVAERTLGVTVHVLDDGFQHLGLYRDVDLLIAAAHDFNDRVLPAGRLREPLAAAAAADALLIELRGDLRGNSSGDRNVAQTLGVATIFNVERTIGRPRWVKSGEAVSIGPTDKILAVAGIARPDRFFSDLEAAHSKPHATLVFRDHHPYTDADIDRIASTARAAGATIILTTEKDAVRLSARGLGDLPIASVPLTAIIEPSFAGWLFARLAERRAASGEPRIPSPSL
jgi:tetraacyldisaccharide 4'-kinase